MDKKQAFLEALCREIKSQKNFLKKETIRTLYFGGGTPSQLSIHDFKTIFAVLNHNFDLSNCEEITLEANPEDLNAEYIAGIKELPFNRISMGVQSFSDKDLKLLNRRHNASRAIQAVKDCQAAGFGNISIDLMYGLPGQTIEDWKKNLKTALSLNVTHISSYHLIYEEGTALYRMLEAGKIKASDEELSLQMFRLLIDELGKGGFEHYEISNFCKPGMWSKHNTSYWMGVPYLGLGPGAHSFDGESRYFNIGDLKTYCSFTGDDSDKISEKETLSEDEKYNEYILTTLRTMWGLPLNNLRSMFGEKKYAYCLKMARPHLKNQMLKEEEGFLKLTQEGIFISDGIMSDLMYITEARE